MQSHRRTSEDAALCAGGERKHGRAQLRLGMTSMTVTSASPHTCRYPSPVIRSSADPSDALSGIPLIARPQIVTYETSGEWNAPGDRPSSHVRIPRVWSTTPGGGGRCGLPRHTKRSTPQMSANPLGMITEEKVGCNDGSSLCFVDHNDTNCHQLNIQALSGRNVLGSTIASLMGPH